MDQRVWFRAAHRCVPARKRRCTIPPRLNASRKGPSSGGLIASIADVFLLLTAQFGLCARVLVFCVRCFYMTSRGPDSCQSLTYRRSLILYRRATRQSLFRSPPSCSRGPLPVKEPICPIQGFTATKRWVGPPSRKTSPSSTSTVGTKACCRSHPSLHWLRRCCPTGTSQDTWDRVRGGMNGEELSRKLREMVPTGVCVAAGRALAMPLTAREHKSMGTGQYRSDSRVCKRPSVREARTWHAWHK
jgi:hypothetical protein